MKLTFFAPKFGLLILLMVSFAALQARNISIVAPVVMTLDTTPPTTTITTTPKTTTTTTTTQAAPAPAPKPEKEKKEGFNSHTRFGIRAGGLISKQDYESSANTENPTSKFGPDLAILASIPIGGGFFMIQPELHWMQKGYKSKDANRGDITTTLDYVELPLLARVNFGGSLKIFVFAGPSIGWLIDGKFDPDNGSNPTDFLNSTETSGYVGLGVGIGTFEIDLRYVAGLNDISSTDQFKNAKNSSFGAGITLKF
jgi:hypothetical protein